MGLSEMDAVVHQYTVPFRSGLGNVAEATVLPGRALHLALIRGQLVLWAAVNPDRDPVTMRFHLAGTGAPINSNWFHVGSVVENGTGWHLFSEQNVIRSSGGLREPGPGPRPGPTA